MQGKTRKEILVMSPKIHFLHGTDSVVAVPCSDTKNEEKPTKPIPGVGKIILIGVLVAVLIIVGVLMYAASFWL